MFFGGGGKLLSRKAGGMVIPDPWFEASGLLSFWDRDAGITKSCQLESLIQESGPSLLGEPGTQQAETSLFQ